MIEVEVKDLFQGAVFSATPRLHVFEGGHHSGEIDKFKSLLGLIIIIPIIIIKTIWVRLLNSNVF